MEKFKLGPNQKKWIKSLKEHPERQMKGQLGKMNKNGFYKVCCLGEGGLITKTCHWGLDGNLVSDSDELILSPEGARSLGLRNGKGEPLSINEGMPSLAEMNDDGMSWPEIAVILETFPEEYFIKSV